ncbi:hypothetical protein NIASO_18840 [Niabella soli DSM 19437]|uniref:Uncharacterized protein n=1 Tax=Niabella soli DSM 19437 TaxID=929713 RepID=W0F9G0_9BACT|nr:hypothetical protein NIASO_18840 [Niabella soli DSM 19437]
MIAGTVFKINYLPRPKASTSGKISASAPLLSKIAGAYKRPDVILLLLRYLYLGKRSSGPAWPMPGGQTGTKEGGQKDKDCERAQNVARSFHKILFRRINLLLFKRTDLHFNVLNYP